MDSLVCKCWIITMHIIDGLNPTSHLNMSDKFFAKISTVPLWLSIWEFPRNVRLSYLLTSFSFCDAESER